MHLNTVLFVLALASTSLAGILHLDLYTESGDDGPVVGHNQQVLKSLADDPPKWKRRDEGHLVPLIPGAKTGALPVEVEEGLTYALGPRFANVFIDAALSEQNGTSAAVASCNPIKCAGTVIKAIPCITAAIACKCKDPILKCPVPIKDMCSCVNCLPAPLRDFLNKLGICSGSFDNWPSLPAADDSTGDYPEYLAYSTRSSYLLAFRGDISKNTVAEASELASIGLCPGVPCGDCPCCLGLCVLGNCVGACVG